MPRRPGVRCQVAPPTSLALVLCILIAFAALLSPAAADQPAQQEPPGESPPSESAAEGASSGKGATHKAERLLRRAEHEAEKAAKTPDEAGGSGSPASATHGVGGSGTKASRQAARAERAAQRAARKAAGSAPKEDAGAAAPAAAKGKGGERSREERRHAHEEQRRKSGRESYKEKQARIAREAREAAEASLGSQGSTGKVTPPTAVAAAGGLAPSATPETKTAAVGSGARAVQGAKTVRVPARAKRRRHAAGAGAASGSAPVAALSTAGEASAATGAGSAAKPRRHAGAKRHASAARRSSPLVTTVTRIIGVVPTAVWLLMGALALAVLAFATSSRLAERRVRRLDRQRRELLEDVGLLQAALLPELPGRLGAVATTAAYRPASGPGAGGDFYDVFALPEGLVAIVVGDVSGHGRDALPHTTLLRYTLRAYLEAGLDPREALRAAAPALERQLGGSFATVVLATYDPRERILTYSCAGHPHPLLTGLDPGEAIIAASAPPIGAGRPTGTRQTVLAVPGGALAAFYTDGVIEARVEGELYGQGRLAAELERLSSGEASAASLLDRVAEQTDRRPDDMAACVIGISGGDEAPRIVSEQIELDGREAGHARASRFLAAAGVPQAEIGRVLSAARAIAADHGSALLTIEAGEAEGSPRLTLTHDNVAPLRARALARTQEVAL
ncbi:MAG TPA: PP2C family protein-serine/threonine phosphatase [Solirubrobacteraceae bacterium]|nr:PP2C family protein-serine/threonine phosphatase [Solirubrobacteraceae bacterium]